MNRLARWLFVAGAGVPAVLFLAGAVLLRSPHLFFAGCVLALVGGIASIVSLGMQAPLQRLAASPGEPGRKQAAIRPGAIP